VTPCPKKIKSKKFNHLKMPFEQIHLHITFIFYQTTVTKEIPKFLSLMPLEQARNQTVNCQAAAPRPPVEIKKKNKN
jgi:hypothetical protein